MEKKKIFLKYATLVLLVALIAFIFVRSLQPGDESREESETVGRLLNQILKFFNIDTELGQLFVRKLAHFAEYFVLGTLAYLTAFQFAIPLPFALCPAFSFFIASVDELIQLFVPGRDGKIADVILDLSGAVCGIALTFLAIYLFTKKSKKREKNT